MIMKELLLKTIYYCNPIAGLKTSANLLQYYLTNM